MADRNVHYEAAFEAYLRHRGIPYVAVDEAKRALFSNAKLKSFDFVVYRNRPADGSDGGANLLVDVKGRQARDAPSQRSFQTWATERDIEDLMQWEQIFGEGFRGLLMFIYWIEPPLAPEPGMFEHRDRWYLLLGVDLAEYRNHMRRRSVKWETVALPAEDFRQLARPIESWL